MDKKPSIKILFLADTHLGFDYPIKPKIKRRRRGDDFFNNYNAILEKAFNGEADLVVHGGDMFYRARVHPAIVTKAFEPLIKLAELGVPVFIVPGNHERSFLPVSLFDTHENIIVFDRPKTIKLNMHNTSIAFAGFPCVRKGIKDMFTEQVNKTGITEAVADFKFLCMHQTVEGATVGIQNYTFRYGNDIIRGKDIPAGLNAVLSGHIHREQILTKDLSGRSFASKVIYPGCIDRTSFVERRERKGYYLIDLKKNDNSKNAGFKFCELEMRPMIEETINTEKLSEPQLETKIKSIINNSAVNAIIRIKPVGEYNKEKFKYFKAAYLREIAPETMNVETVFSIRSLK